MPSERATPSAGVTALRSKGVPSDVFDPEALEVRRFDRDRAQAVTVLYALVAPLAAFGVTDAMLASGNRTWLTVAWAVRAAAIAALAYAGLLLHRAPSRARFERILFTVLAAGVVLSVLTHLGRPRDSLLVTRFELLCVVGYYVALPLRTLLQAVPALTMSAVSVALVLFWHTEVPGPEILSQVVCFALANVLGVLIARRRQAADAEEDAAWRAVTFAHATLQRTVRELRALRSVVPICPSCRKVRGAREAWQQLEAFVAERGDVEFSKVLCPACLQKEFGAVLSPEETPDADGRRRMTDDRRRTTDDG